MWGVEDEDEDEGPLLFAVIINPSDSRAFEKEEAVEFKTLLKI